MAASGDAFRKQHKISEIEEPKKDDVLTPEDEDDNFTEGGEGNTDIDELHRKAYGDTENKPVGNEINEDEIDRVKDIVTENED